MITAIPIQRGYFSAHFSKADAFCFFDQDGRLIKRVNNPVKSEQCSTRSKLMALFEDYRVSRVIVRRVGEKMLDRLLSHSILVFSPKELEMDVDKVVLLSEENLSAITQEEKAKVVVRSQQRSKQSGCCHHEASEGESSGSCCQKLPDQTHLDASANHHRKRCCQRD